LAWKENVAVERAPLLYPRVFDDPEAARQYATSARKRGEQIGKVIATSLSKQGFEKGRILDAGCGAGDVAIALAHGLPGAKVAGLDLSEPLLESARSSSAKAGLTDRLSFEKGDVQKMPFEDDWFDVAVSVNMLHVVQDPVAMLDEVERVLTRKGRLVLSDIKRSWVGFFMPILKAAYTPAEVKELLHRSKLRSWKVYERFLWLAVEACESSEFLANR
jgi:ubiquinone/menaquinone biosynthesis C-methylase UbiE